MNEYYHAIQFTFNIWYVILPFGMFAMGILGSRRYYLNSERIKKRGNAFSTIIYIVAILLEILLVMLVIKESSLGIIQFFANNLAKEDDPLYALIAAAISQGLLFVFFYWLLVNSARIGAYTKLGYLTEKRHEASNEK